MRRIRSIAKVFLFVGAAGVICSATVSQGAPILLAELYHSLAAPDSAGESFNFSSFEDQVELSRRPTSADVGQAFPADPVTLAKFDRILTSGNNQLDSGFGIYQPPRQAVTDEFFNGPFMGEIPTVHSPDISLFIMNAYVPQLGPGFSGYRITGLDQVINGISIEQLNPSTFLYWGAHTIRIFGEQIPEPAMSLLVAQALVCLAWLQKRSFTRRHRDMSDDLN
jgi:hypothetical protein